MQLFSKKVLFPIGVVAVVVMGLLAFAPSRQMVLDMAGVGQPQSAAIDPQAIEQILRDSKSIDAATLVGHDGLYYLQAGNLIGTIANERFSAYEDLVAEGKIADGSTILTDESQIPGQARNDGDASTPNPPSHDPVSILDSATFDFTISGQQISGSVIQSGLKTSLIANDAGFIKNLAAFTTSHLAEGSNLYFTQGRFNAAFGNKSTSDLSEGSNLYYTQGRFDAAFGNKTTDDLAEGSSNLYSQWAIVTGGIVYGNSVGIGSNSAPGATLDVSGSLRATGAVTLSNYTTNGGLLYADASGALTQLAVGTAGQCLKSSGGVPSWGACAAGDSITGSGAIGQLAYFNSGSTLAGGSGLVWDPDNNTLSVNGTIAMTGSIIPSADITYDLGSPSFQWRDVYIGPGSLYINGQKVLEEGSNSIIVSADPDQDLVLQTSGSGDVELGAIGTGLIQLKSNVMLTGGKNISTTDNSAVSFADGILGGNLKLSGNVLEATNLNGGISITPAGNGGTYFTNGNVGIGTTNPGSMLHIYSGGLMVQNSPAVGDIRPSFIDRQNGSDLLVFYSRASLGDGYIRAPSANLHLSAAGGTDTDLSIVPSGNVGIGISDPGARLHVAGNIRLNNELVFGSSSALTGAIRLANGHSINFRNQTDSADVIGLRVLNGISYFANGAILATAQGGATTLYVNGNNGNVGIGTTTPGHKLDVVSTGATTNGAQITANSLTTGRGLNVTSTSTAMTTGGLLGLSWAPGSATTMTGDLLSVNVGANGTVGNLLNLMSDGLSVFAVSQSQIVANVPVSFRAAGNMNIANDLFLSNSTSANIKTTASLRIQAGERFNSSDLTLGTYNNGAVVFDSKYVATNNDTMLGLGVYMPTARLSLAAGTTAAEGILFGGDTNLYRSAADTLRTDDLLVTGGLQIGDGAILAAMYSATAAWDPIGVDNGEVDSTTVAVAGAEVGDLVTVSFSEVVPDGVVLTAQVSAADTVKVTLLNMSVSSVDLSSGTVRVQVNKF